MNRGFSAFLFFFLIIIVVLAILAPVWWNGGIPATKDTVLTNVPLAVYHQRALHGEESLFWCHDGGCGFPIHAESQGGFFHPWNFITALTVPVSWVYQVRWVGAVVFGCLAMFAFLRGRMVSLWGALVGGIAYGLGGYWAARLDMLPLLLAAPVLPLGWLAVEWIIGGRWNRGVALGMGAIGWGLLAGHFQLTIIAVFGVVIYGLGRGLSMKNFAAVVTGVILMCCLGVGIGGLQVLPSLELLVRSGRMTLAGLGTGDFSLFPLQVIGMLFPRMFGFQRTVRFDSVEEWTGGDYWGSGVFWEACPYMGAGIFVLALVAMFKRYPCAGWLGIIALIGLVLALGNYTPLWSWLQGLGFKGFRIPARFLLLSAAGVAALGGIGVDAIADSVKRRWILGVVIVLAAIGLAISLWVASEIMPAVGDTSEWMGLSGERLERTLTHAQVTLPPWVPDQAVPLGALMVLGLAVLLKLPRGIIALVVGLEIVFFACRVLPPSMDYDKLKQDARVSVSDNIDRVYSVPLYRSGGDWNRLKAVPANVNWLSGISRLDVRGSLFDERMMRYTQAAKEEFIGGGHRLLGLAGTDVILSRQELDNPGFEKISDGDVFAYRVKDAVPIAYFPEQLSSLTSSESVLYALMNPNLEIGRFVYLEGWKGIVVTGAESDVDVKKWKNGVIELNTDGGGGVLRITEAYDPGWNAQLDGGSVSLLRADYLFMALQVPQGHHRIRLWYEPPRFWQGVGLSAVSIMMFILFWVFPIRRPEPVEDFEDEEESIIY